MSSIGNSILFTKKSNKNFVRKIIAPLEKEEMQRHVFGFASGHHSFRKFPKFTSDIITHTLCDWGKTETVVNF